MSKPVYFLQGREGGLIKIGQAKDPVIRRRDLSRAYKIDLHFLGVIEDGSMTESQAHARFREHRVHGEWFHPHLELLEFISERATSRPEVKPFRRYPAVSEISAPVKTRVLAEVDPKTLKEMKILCIELELNQAQLIERLIKMSLPHFKAESRLLGTIRTPDPDKEI